VYRGFVIAVLGLTACGRLGFDAVGGGGGGDGDIDSGSGEIIDAALAADAKLGDPTGFWIVDRARMRSELVFRSRADLMNGIRGDLSITGDFQPQFFVRWSLLASGFSSAIDFSTGTLEDDGAGPWILKEPGATFVYAVVFENAEVVKISFEPGDPRNTATPAITDVDLRRSDPPRTDVLGDWVYAAIKYPNQAIFAAGTCVSDGVSMSGVQTGTLTVPASMLAKTDTTITTYPSTDCSGVPTVDVDTVTGYFEFAGDQYSAWASVAGAGSFTSTGTVSLTDTGIRYTRDTCQSTTTSCDSFLEIIDVVPAGNGG
jgi:hypothetical protein